MLKNYKMFTKLYLSYALIILFSFLLFGIVFLYYFHINLYNEFEETYKHYYEQVESFFETSEGFQWDREETAASLNPTLNHKEFNIIIYNSEGQPNYVPDNYDYIKDKISNEFIQEARISDGFISKGGKLNEELNYTIASEISTINETGIMVMFFHNLGHQYRQMLFLIYTAFLSIIAFAGLILWFISKKITAPLIEMNDIALKYAKGDFSKSVNVSSKDEIGQLGSTFNYMANELNNLEEKRKEFIANVSHDLRSPLTSIKGFLIALLDGTIPDRKRERYYLLMKEETERVIKLVNDTLDMSQLEAGQIQLKPVNYNIVRQLQVIAVKLEPQLAGKELEINICNNFEEIHVFADRDRIEQALINLIQNAIQFSKPRTEILIQLEKELDHVQIVITDQGEGIGPDQLKHIWKRFYKTDKSRTNKAGVGIGLSIVKSIMDLHKIEIKVSSDPGQGTTFSFSLPLSNKD